MDKSKKLSEATVTIGKITKVNSQEMVRNLNAEFLNGISSGYFPRFVGVCRIENVTSNIIGYGQVDVGWKGNGPFISFGLQNIFAILQIEMGNPHRIFVSIKRETGLSEWTELSTKGLTVSDDNIVSKVADSQHNMGGGGIKIPLSVSSVAFVTPKEKGGWHDRQGKDSARVPQGIDAVQHIVRKYPGSLGRRSVAEVEKNCSIGKSLQDGELQCYRFRRAHHPGDMAYRNIRSSKYSGGWLKMDVRVCGSFLKRNFDIPEDNKLRRGYCNKSKECLFGMAALAYPQSYCLAPRREVVA